ncbi:MAG: hypothetical protein Q4D48_09940, partial [Coriobacteriales bacterium]|nr:hypothetical protein [Coriobacteriales bacterium]
VIIALTIVLTGFYLLKTPLGSPIFEILSDGEGSGSLVIFSGSFGMPLPLALISILGLLLMCIATAAGSSLTIVLRTDTVIGLVSKAFKR